MNEKLNGKLILFSLVLSILSISQSSALDCDTESLKTEPHERLVGDNFPTGSIMQFAGDVAPRGWFVCDGQRVDGEQYKDLYRVLGTRYTPRDLNPPRKDYEFCVPDLRGRVIVGFDARATALVSNSNVLGNVGGEEKHTLTITEIPNHHHTPVHFDPAAPYMPLVAEQHHQVSSSGPITALGDSTPHNNMQPYLVLNYIIKASAVNVLEPRLSEIENQLRQITVRLDQHKNVFNIHAHNSCGPKSGNDQTIAAIFE